MVKLCKIEDLIEMKIAVVCYVRQMVLDSKSILIMSKNVLRKLNSLY